MALTTVQTRPVTRVRSLTPYVLGLDAGATKTTAAIAQTGSIIASGTSGPASMHGTVPEDSIRHIQSAVLQSVTQFDHGHQLHFRHVVIGMAGIDSPNDQIQAERLVKKALARWLRPGSNLQVLNDIHIVRRSGSDDPYGMALIAGTGAHGFGIGPHGDMAFVGGLEYILADEGSAYDIGLKSLRAAVRSADGRSQPTKLEDAILKHFKVKSIRALEPIIYHQPRFGKYQIAQLAQLAEIAAAGGDWRAREIIDETLAELMGYVQALVTKLHLKQVPCDLVVAGGVFKMKLVPFWSRFKRGVKTVAPRASVILPKQPPVWGAVRLAQDEALLH